MKHTKCTSKQLSIEKRQRSPLVNLRNVLEKITMGTICNIQENVNVVLETQSKTYTMHLVEIKGKKRKDKGGGATMQSYLVENLK